MAGTANDYIGSLSTTRTGRICAKWLSDYDFEQMQKLNKSQTTTFSPRTLRMIAAKSPQSQKHSSMQRDTRIRSNLSSQSKSNITNSIHTVDPKYLNDELYPERSVRNASNYCRDPSRNIAGTWCYTTDPLVPQDLCDVKDCDKSGISL